MIRGTQDTDPQETLVLGDEISYMVPLQKTQSVIYVSRKNIKNN